MAGKRVAVITPDGQFGTVDEKDVESLPDGARVLTKQQVAERKVEEEYENQSTGTKVVGALLGGRGFNPTHEAFLEKGREAFSGGLYPAAKRVALDELGPKGAGKAYAEHLEDLETGKPGASTAGTVAGTAGALATGFAGGGVAGGGVARALPMNAASAIGAPIEHGITRALGGLAARGTLGRAAATSAGMAARGVAEGTALAGLETVTNSVTHDTPITGDKMYASFGNGALLGGGLGGILGFSGSLVASGARGVGKAMRGAMKQTATEAEAATAATRGVEVPFIDPDAGLGPIPKGEKAFSFDGAERRPIQLRPGGRPGVATEDAIGIGRKLSIDPDAGLHAPTGKDASPFNIADLSMTDLFTEAGSKRAVSLADTASGKAARSQKGVRNQFEIGIDPDAGLKTGAPEAADAFRLSSAKNVPREVGFGGADEPLPTFETRSPIKVPDVPGAPKPSGIQAALSDPNNAARNLAYDQAWKAVGGGYGLQTTRYAKEAQKYFGGTRDLGEVAMRYGVIDMGDAAASPLAASYQAAKSGTAGNIAPKVAEARSAVGEKLGAMTEASGARIDMRDVDAAFGRVRQPFDRIAGNEHVVNAIDNYHASLRSKLTSGRDGSVSLQDLLEQRKGLDQIVYEETKTLDPGRRVAALREVRGQIEGLITDALDAASGKIPGAERDAYKALKRDYHALSILNEAAEDSAARAAKGATLGLGEKFALASAVASGNFAAAPVLAVGGKLLRERGNAAAAAFLSRAADMGTFENFVRKFDERIGKAAAGVLKEAPKAADGASKSSTKSAQPKVEDGRKAVAAKREKANAIMKWMSDYQANPRQVIEQVADAAAQVGRSAGPKAAESYSASTMRAISFISAHIPVKERRDPLDPRSIPPLSYDEANRLVRATTYAVKPEAIFDDFEKGIITPEGLRAAKTFVPESFLEFQMKLQSKVEEQMMHNKKLTQVQRLRIDKLLGYPAGADLRPNAIAGLQANFMKAEEPPPANAQTGGPVNMKIQQTGFDAIEARKAS